MSDKKPVIPSVHISLYPAPGVNFARLSDEECERIPHVVHFTFRFHDKREDLEIFEEKYRLKEEFLWTIEKTCQQLDGVVTNSPEVLLGIFKEHNLIPPKIFTQEERDEIYKKYDDEQVAKGKAIRIERIHCLDPELEKHFNVSSFCWKLHEIYPREKYYSTLIKILPSQEYAILIEGKTEEEVTPEVFTIRQLHEKYPYSYIDIDYFYDKNWNFRISSTYDSASNYQTDDSWESPNNSSSEDDINFM